MANERINSGDVACKVPEQLLITRDRVLKEVDPIVAEFITINKLPDYWVLATFLVEMFAATDLEEECKYKHYILSLPRETGSVLEWGRSAIGDLLKGSPVEGTAYEMNNDVNDAIQFLMKQMPTVSPYPKYYTPENLRWAFAILFSRVIRSVCLCCFVSR